MGMYPFYRWRGETAFKWLPEVTVSSGSSQACLPECPVRLSLRACLQRLYIFVTWLESGEWATVLTLKGVWSPEMRIRVINRAAEWASIVFPSLCASQAPARLLCLGGGRQSHLPLGSCSPEWPILAEPVQGPEPWYPGASLSRSTRADCSILGVLRAGC